MTTWLTVSTIVLAVLVVLALGTLAAVLIRDRRRSARLRARFGPEYDRALARRGSRTEAERELAGREERRRSLAIRELDPARRQAFVGRWRSVQATFVDHPLEAVRQADQLVAEVMSERGYPADHFERRADDVSVDHPDVTGDYRAAHRVATAASRDGSATTEDCRQAMMRFRSLFEELLGAEPAPAAERPEPAPSRRL